MATVEIIEETLTRQVAQFNSLSNNVANANTPGYLSETQFTEMMNDGKLVQNSSFINSALSSAKSSHRNLDIALLSPSYFLISIDNDFFVTRNGRFHVNQHGDISHSSGGLLVGKNGPINITNSNVKIDGNGQVFENGSLIDTIQTVTASEITESHKGYGLYRADGIAVANNQNLQQYAINVSNVNVSEQTTQMIELSRSIQTIQKVNTAYERMMSLGVSELGRNK